MAGTPEWDIGDGLEDTRPAAPAVEETEPNKPVYFSGTEPLDNFINNPTEENKRRLAIFLGEFWGHPGIADSFVSAGKWLEENSHASFGS